MKTQSILLTLLLTVPGLAVSADLDKVKAALSIDADGAKDAVKAASDGG